MKVILEKKLIIRLFQFIEILLSIYSFSLQNILLYMCMSPAEHNFFNIYERKKKNKEKENEVTKFVIEEA